MPDENDDASLSHKEFFEKALAAAGEWARFADPKALGVAVFLGFGSTDLIRHTGQLFYGFSENSCLEWLTTLCFLGACGFAVLIVFFVSKALFPRLTPKGPRSLFYFGGIAQFGDPTEYEQEVRNKTPEELESYIASQAWNVAKLAATKHRWTWWAYFWLLLFIACWVVARVAASLG
jgi:hypothetical protein